MDQGRPGRESPDGSLTTETVRKMARYDVWLERTMFNAVAVLPISP